MPKQKINLWMLGVGVIVLVAGIFAVYFALSQPCNETTLIEGNQFVPEVKVSEGMSRLVCVGTQPIPLILSLIGSSGIVVGLPLTIKGLVGKNG